MKTPLVLFFLACLCSVPAFAVAPLAPPEVVERGPHHQVLRRLQNITLPDGRESVRVSTWTELQTGLHRWENNAWVETDPRIELFQDGAVVRHLQYGVIFAPNLATPNSIDLSLPDGQRMTGHILGLAYVEGPDAILIAEIKDCAGRVVGPDQNDLVFADAFTDYAIDVQFHVRRGSFSQDVLIRERLDPPTAFGLSENAHLILMTEWTTFPAAQIESRTWAPAVGRQNAWTDDRIDLGSMRFITGKAFATEGGPEGTIPVAKALRVIQGRTVLEESVPWSQVQPKLQNLPPPQAAVPKAPGPNPRVLQARNGWNLPERKQPRPLLKPIQMALATPPPERGFVLDYETVSSISGQTFQADRTYSVSGGTVTLSGTTTFEGSAVIKMAPGTTLKIAGPVVCQSSAYAPIIFTARDDHSIGETIGTNVLSGYYGTPLSLDYDATNDFHDLRISYADTAIATDYDTGRNHTLRHAQITHCRYGLVPINSTFRLRNVLFHDVLTNFYSHSYAATGHCEHVTIDQCAVLNQTSSSCYLYLTNSLLTGITNFGSSYQTNASDSVQIASDGSTVFQSVGPAGHYLINGSAFRNAGTTNIDPTLAADLKERTTYPPVVLAIGTISLSTTLYPQAQRDTDRPDLGAHYAALDYVAYGLLVTNATLTLQPGVAIATRGPASSYAILLAGGAELVAAGTATQPVRLARYNLVMEPATTNWANAGAAPSIYASYWDSTGPNPKAAFRFTHFFMSASDGAHFLGTPQRNATAGFADCQFLGGAFHTERPEVGVTNCLFDRVAVWLDDSCCDAPFNYTLRNCLFHGGSHTLMRWADSPWTYRDNLFDQTAIVPLDGVDDVTNDHNAYTTNLTRLTPTNATGDVSLAVSNVTYQAGSLGRFYLPTSAPLNLLTNAGSASNAGLVGLFYHTILTNNVAEGGSTNDLSFHYLALDANGRPVDTDGDGIPDYLEDTNRDGAAGSGETKPNDAADLGLRVQITNPRNNSTLP